MRVRGALTVAGLVFGIGTVVWAHTHMGGNVRAFLQPESLTVVLGGTLAALLVSFPLTVLASAADGVLALLRGPARPAEVLVPEFVKYARQARRQGMLTVEREAEHTTDEFLARALTLSVSGLSIDAVKEALDVEARVAAEQDEARAQVFEAAAGYAPTLGIIGAVLGLMRVMEHLQTADVGAGIAAAFVATIYGVGAANLVFLPLATRLRAHARTDAFRRELVISGVAGLQSGASPGVLEERLAGYLQLGRTTNTLAGAA